MAGDSGQLTVTMSLSRNTVSRLTSRTPSFRAISLVHVRVVGDEVEPERTHDLHHVAPDVAEPDGPQGLARQPDTDVFGTLREARRALTRQPVLGHDLAGQRQDERQDADGDGPGDVRPA